MGKAKLILTLTTALAVFIAAFLGLNIWMQSGQVTQAKELGRAVAAYTEAIDAPCSAEPAAFNELTTCLEELTRQQKRVGEITLEEFKELEEEPGYVLMKNEGKTSLASANFTLLLNKNHVDTGCTINGSIDPGYVCKLAFNQTCSPGDVLEVTYNQQRVHLKTC